MIEQGTEFTHGHGNVGLKGVFAEVVVEHGAHRTVLERRTAHVPRGAERVLTLLGKVNERAGERRHHGVFVFLNLLGNCDGDVFSAGNFVFEEFNVERELAERGVRHLIRAGEGKHREQFVVVVNLLAEGFGRFFPVDDDAGETSVVLHDVHQVFDIGRENDFKAVLLECFVHAV